MFKLTFPGFSRQRTQDGAVLPTSQLHIPMPKVTPPPAKPLMPARGANKARG